MSSISMAPSAKLGPEGDVMKWTGWISTPGGEVIVGFLLALMGAGFYACKIPKGEDAIVAGFTLISRAMVGLATK